MNFNEKLISLRKELPVIQDGSVEFISHENPNVFAYRRSLGEEELLVFCNLGEEEIEIDGIKTEDYERIIGNYQGIAVQENGFMLRLYETVVLKKM